MSSWNFAEVYEAIAAEQPDAPALIQGETRRSWAELMDRSSGLAAGLLEAGLSHQSKVAIYTYNCCEYLEGVVATLRAGMVPINTNYRYQAAELAYLWENSDTEAVIFQGTFTEQVDGLRAQLPLVKLYVHVDDGHGSCPDFAVPFESLAGSGASIPSGTVRTPDDLIMLYTGGTTGMPKGVMWRQDDLFARLNGGGFRRWPDEGRVADIVAGVRESGRGQTLLPACPLMHGTGLFSALECFAEAGCVAMLEGRRYDPAELASVIEREGVNTAVIVGDPFARPLLQTLEAEPGRYDLTSLFAIFSSGAMWSEEIKAGLLEHHGTMILIDAFSSSEALGMGNSVSSKGKEANTGTFKLGPEVRVITEDGREVTPGSDEVGVLALGGRNPMGYYKDEEKSAATFRVIDGKRYSVPGDFARVHADGSIQLLGRGSQCINTAGEKVFPEEVEEVLKTHPAVADACVVGVPDERTGERVVASAELWPGKTAEVEELIEHVRANLSHYKAPKQLRIIDSIGRAANGKMDYKRHRDEALTWAQA